jgi:small neutral amino acid transporter SnatA (MarC family)
MPEIISLTLQWLLILAPIGALLYWNSLATPAPASRSALASSIAGVGGAFALLVLATLIGDPLLDLFNISEPNWRIAAGSLLILGAVRLVLMRDPFSAISFYAAGDPDWMRVVRLALWLANPAALAAAMSFALFRGRAETLIAIAIALAITQVLLISGRDLEARDGRPILREIARALLLGTVLVGLRLIIDGVDGI